MQLYSDRLEEAPIQNKIDAYRLFRGLAGHYGFDSYAVVDLRSIEADFTYKSTMVLYSLTEVELDMLDTDGRSAEDTAIARMATSMAPFILTADGEGARNPLLKALGFKGLTAAPLATPDGQRYGLLLMSRSQPPSSDETRLAALYLDALFVFQAYHDALLEPHGSSEYSARDLEIMRMTADGWTSVDIALKLGVSEHTINANVATLLKRLQVANRAQMTAKAIRTKLIG